MTQPAKSPADQIRSRRQFLKTSAATAALAGGLSLSRSAHAAGDGTIKVGLIGCGGRGSGAAVNAMNAGKDVRLVAMGDVFADVVKARRESIGKSKPEQMQVDDAHCFAGFDAHKRVIESGVDAVLIACASRYHSKYLKAALEAGKHVFVEKPQAIDPAGVHELLAAAELAKTKGLSIVSGMQSRHDPGMQETVKRIHDGAIGEIVAIEENFQRAPYQLVNRKPEWTEMEYQFRNWYHFCWLSGDDVTQSLVHNVDKAAWATHEKLPARAHAFAGRSSSFGEVFGDMFDHHAVVYQYDNGMRMYAFCRTQNSCHSEVSDVFMGTKGRCYLLQNRIEGETNWKYDGPRKNPYDVEHEVLFQSIRDGKPVNEGFRMAHSTMTCILGQFACYTGKQLTWDQVFNSKFAFGPTGEVNFDIDPPTKVDPKTGNYPIPIPGFTKLV